VSFRARGFRLRCRLAARPVARAACVAHEGVNAAERAVPVAPATAHQEGRRDAQMNLRRARTLRERQRVEILDNGRVGASPRVPSLRRRTIPRTARISASDAPRSRASHSSGNDCSPSWRMTESKLGYRSVSSRKANVGKCPPQVRCPEKPAARSSRASAPISCPRRWKAIDMPTTEGALAFTASTMVCVSSTSPNDARSTECPRCSSAAAR